METLRQIFERETGMVAGGHPSRYSAWLEQGISKEYAKRDRLIKELMKENKALKKIINP